MVSIITRQTCVNKEVWASMERERKGRERKLWGKMEFKIVVLKRH